MKNVNDVEELYDSGYVGWNDWFICPVCDKKYKTKSGVDKHMEKRDCFDVVSLFKGTRAEFLAYGLYKELCSIFNKKATFNSFKKSSSHKRMLRYMALLEIEKLTTHRESYMAFVVSKYRAKTIAQTISRACLQSYMKEYKKHFHTYGDIDFPNQRIPLLELYHASDDMYFDITRDIETNILSVSDAMNDPAMVTIIESSNMPLDYKDRIMYLRNTMNLENKDDRQKKTSRISNK